MKKNILSISLLFIAVIFITTGCTETVSTDENGNNQTEFKFGEVAKVNDTEIQINSVTKIMNECLYEYNGECWSGSTPSNEYYLVFDVTIINNSNTTLSISSMLSFNIKDENGEQGSYAILTNSIKSQLDGSIMAGDTLKGQIAYDVKESEYYNFYYQDSLLDDSIKFVVDSADITN